ncbi:MAG: hypothetical protein HFH15_01160 [Ruminococcus sp.]|nr:hypothetical protein [Ruminococcus sp.]
MKKKLSVILAAVCLLVFAYLYAHIDKNTYLYDRNTDSADFTGTGILKEGEEITQTFTCTEDSLDGINLKATLVGDAGQVNVEYSLIDAESGSVVREALVSGSEIENNKFNRLSFQTLTKTAGKDYILKLTETGSDDITGVSFYLDAGDEYKERLFIKGNETKGMLIVRLITHRFDLETFVVLSGIVAFIAGFMKMLYKLFK